MLAGLAVLFNTPGGWILVLIGAYIGFTTSSTRIDTKKKRIKFSNNVFGIIPVGKWIALKPEMKIEIRKKHTGYRTYSKSNRVLDIHVKDFRIILFGADDTEIMPVKKFSSFEAAQEALEELKIQLGVS